MAQIVKTPTYPEIGIPNFKGGFCLTVRILLECYFGGYFFGFSLPQELYICDNIIDSEPYLEQ